MPTKIKLEQPVTDYFRFQDNQVLTASQLNHLIDYFETQHRLSRTCLIGVGNVCGLEAKLAGDDVIEITKGCGITTDGDLIYEDSLRKFTEFIAFEDSNAQYLPFTNVENIQLWQLVDGTQDDDISTYSVKEIVPKVADKLEDIIVLAYLDNYGKDQGPCTPLDCNNQGEQQVAEVKYLLLDNEIVDKIIEAFDSIYSSYDALLTSYFQLPRLRTPRVVINAKTASNYNALINAYHTTRIRQYRREVRDALLILTDQFDAVLDPGGTAKREVWYDHFEAIFPTALTRGAYSKAFQYRYGHFEDLIQAYSEIREHLYEVLVACLPSVMAFPRHLMLGRLAGVSNGRSYRHDFYPSPINTNNDRGLAQVRSMYRRLHLLIAAYEDPIPASDEELFLRITPSLKATRSLSEKAIPYYYKFSEELLRYWNFAKAQRRQERETLSYHSHEYASRSDGEILNPIDYEHEDKDFYRIEGHLGKAFGDAMEDIKGMQSNSGLNFDVIALRIEGENSIFDLNDYRYYFQDLEALLDAWKAEQKCLAENVTRFFSAFSLKQPGQHLMYASVSLDSGESESRGMFRRSGPAAYADLKLGGGSAINIGGTVRGTVGTGSTFTFGGRDATGEALLSGYSVAEQELVQAKKVFGIAKEGNNIFVESSGLYQQETTVKDNVVSEEDAIGSKMFEVLQTNLDDSSYELRERTYDGIYAYLDQENIQVTDDVMLLAVEVPVNVVSFLNTLISKLPDDLDQLNTTTINAFKKAMENLVKNVQSAKQEVLPRINDGSYVKKGYEEDYLLLLNQIEVNACAAKKIEVLMDEFIRRKEEILKLTSFAHYAAEHPGLEHKGGVPKGGTFVIVYKEDKKVQLSPGLSQGTLQTPLIRPKLTLLESLSKSVVPIAYRIDATQLEQRAQQISLQKGLSIKKAEEKAKRTELTTRPDEFARFVIDNHEMVSIDQTIKDYQLVTGVSGAMTNLIRDAVYEGITIVSKEGIEPNVSNFTVVADFCLPYRCCSELPPMVFVLPKERIDLRLPVAFVCVKKDLSDTVNIGLLPLTVSPVDGVVSLDVGKEDLLQLNAENKYFFNPAAIDASLLNTTIHFKVNEQETTANLKIVRRPEPAFEPVVPAPIETPFNVRFVVTFTNKTEEMTGENLTYLWDFGDGNTSTDKNPVHTYQFSIRQMVADKEMPVRLRVTNNGCTESTEEKVILKAVDINQIPKECINKSVDVIIADRDRLKEFESDIRPIRAKKDIQSLVSQLILLYSKLIEDEDLQNTYFTGRNNQQFFVGMSNMLEALNYFAGLRTFTDQKNLVPLVAILLLRLFLAVIKCQERLAYGAELKEVFEIIRSTLNTRFLSKYETFLKSESDQITAFLKAFYEETKIQDVTILQEIKALQKKIAGK